MLSTSVPLSVTVSAPPPPTAPDTVSVWPSCAVPLTTGVVVVYTTLFIALNVLIDLFYFVIDPRVSAAGGVHH